MGCRVTKGQRGLRNKGLRHEGTEARSGMQSDEATERRRAERARRGEVEEGRAGSVTMWRSGGGVDWRMASMGRKLTHDDLVVKLNVVIFHICSV